MLGFKIPNEMSSNILEFLPYNPEVETNLYCNEVITFQRKFQLEKQINKIKKWWKCKRLQNTFLKELFAPVDSNFESEEKVFRKYPLLAKKYLINLYLHEYEKEYLFDYPWFYISKLYGNDIDFMPPNIRKFYSEKQELTRSFHVYLFFKMAEISAQHIQYVGW
jgi:hypothetical protein